MGNVVSVTPMAFRVPFSASTVPPAYKFGDSDSKRDDKDVLRRAGQALAGVAAKPSVSVSDPVATSPISKPSPASRSVSSSFSRTLDSKSSSARAGSAEGGSAPVRIGTTSSMRLSQSQSSLTSTLAKRPDLRAKIDKAYGFSPVVAPAQQEGGYGKHSGGVAVSRHVGFPALSAEERIRARTMSVSFLAGNSVNSGSRPPSRSSLRDQPRKRERAFMFEPVNGGG